jgi:hypothetical protein
MNQSLKIVPLSDKMSRLSLGFVMTLHQVFKVVHKRCDLAMTLPYSL